MAGTDRPNRSEGDLVMGPDVEPYIRNALYELDALRSDIVSELGNNGSDLFLKARFVDGVDAASTSLRCVLRK